MPPDWLICSTMNWATCQLALPPAAIAPVMSVAMPILMGPAACAQCGRSSQPLAPPIQPEAVRAAAPESIARRDVPGAKFLRSIDYLPWQVADGDETVVAAALRKPEN